MNMSSKPLDKLEKLASSRVELLRVVLMREIRQLEHITRHMTDLRSINKEYQQSIVGKSEIEPQHLAHRRAFVEKLSGKLEALNEDKTQMVKRIDEKSSELQYCSAQQSAIEIMNEQRKESLLKIDTQREQKTLDEIAGAQHLRRTRLQKEKRNE